MMIFSLLALGLSRAGKAARVERVLITACAAGSAVMNYAAANVVSPRSVLAYTMPPIFLAVVVDRVVAVVRRHVLGDEERSPWSALGRGALYSLRFVLSPGGTAKGLKRALMDATPLPGSHVIESAASVVEVADKPAIEATSSGLESARPKASRSTTKSGSKRGRAGSKTSQFLALVVDNVGPFAEIPLSDVYRITQELAPKVNLDAGSARTALRRALLAAQKGGEYS
jgi:hypothetical protein